MTEAQTPTLDDLLGNPVTARDAITTALVQPEVLAALLAAMDAQESSVEVAVPLETAFLDAVDKYFRQKIGPLPWIRRVVMGTCTAVGAGTCTMSVPGIDTPVTDVEYDVPRPTVGQRYLVRFPVALPPEGTPLAKGPQPYGNPWIKVQGGAPWLYYFSSSPARGLYRVALPPADLSFRYTDELSTLVRLLPGPPTVPNAGEMQLTGPGMATQQLYLEESAWERVSRPELAPGTYPYPLRLHTYPQWGTQGTEPVPPLVSGVPHAHALDTNLGTGLTTDVLLGVGRRSVEEPNLSPYPDAHYYHQVADLLLSTDGGEHWTTVQAGLLLARQLFYYYPAGGFYVAPGGYVGGDTTILNAVGWVADADTDGLGFAGERLDTWMGTYWPDGNPYPSDLAPVPLRGNEPTEYRRAQWPIKHVLARLYVSRNGGTPAVYDFPQPPGWMTQCFLRPTGGGGLCAWWQGHATQFTVQIPTPDPNFFFIEYSGSPDEVWRGERPADGTWTWARVPTPGPNRLIHTNGDGSVALGARYVGPDSVRSIDSHWLTTDAGATWRVLPVPPHFTFVPGTADSYALRGWLIDVP